MLKSIVIGAHAEPLSERHVFNALFATIARRLEPGGRATRFPVLMNHLYWGRLTAAQTPHALSELREVEDGLRSTPVRDVIWNNADPRPHDDTDEPVNRQAANVLEYFTDVKGLPLIARLREGVQECQRTAQSLRIVGPSTSGKDLVFGIGLALFGVAWMILGRKFVPGWTISKGYSANSALPVWTFGMGFILIGCALVVTVVFPGVREWFSSRPVLVFALVVVAIVGWLVVCANAGFLPD